MSSEEFVELSVILRTIIKSDLKIISLSTLKKLSNNCNKYINAKNHILSIDELKKYKKIFDSYASLKENPFIFMADEDGSLTLAFENLLFMARLKAEDSLGNLIATRYADKYR